MSKDTKDPQPKVVPEDTSAAIDSDEAPLNEPTFEANFELEEQGGEIIEQPIGVEGDMEAYRRLLFTHLLNVLQKEGDIALIAVPDAQYYYPLIVRCHEIGIDTLGKFVIATQVRCEEIEGIFTGYEDFMEELLEISAILESESMPARSIN